MYCRSCRRRRFYKPSHTGILHNVRACINLVSALAPVHIRPFHVSVADAYLVAVYANVKLSAFLFTNIGYCVRSSAEYQCRPFSHFNIGYCIRSSACPTCALQQGNLFTPSQPGRLYQGKLAWKRLVSYGYLPNPFLCACVHYKSWKLI